MATLLDGNFWGSESTDSRFGQCDTRVSDDQASTSGFTGKTENKRPEKKGHFVAGKVSSISRNAKNITSKEDPCKVKTSALLYEITERINKLAQPRFRTDSLDSTEIRANVNRIPEASARVRELARPKTVYEPPSKLPGFVTPAALTALATDRILELSRPKKRSTKVSSKRKKLIYSPCSPRILYLARAKNFSKPSPDERGVSRRRKSERSYTMISKWKELGYNVSRHRLQRNLLRERKCPRRARSTNSDRTVITIDVDHESRSRRKVKSARKSRNTLARSKPFKF